MKLRQLEAVRAVLTTGTTTHAADLLGLTQSAISRLISELERELALKLFDRQHGRLEITAEGRLFYRDAEKLLNNFDQIIANARDIRSFQAGSIQLVAMPALAYGLASPAVAEFSTAHPKARISVDVLGQRRDIAERIAAGMFDLGLATLPMDHEGVAVEQLFSVNGVCIMPPDHELAGRDTVTPEDLKGLPFVSVDAGTRLRHRTDELFDDLGVRRLMTVEAKTTIMVCHLVASGAGVSVVHPFVAGALEGRIAIRPFSPPIRFDYGILFPSRHSQSGLVSAFVKVLKAHAERISIDHKAL
jgi:DNA-binding transcriptional LysR family regulator